MFRFAAPFVGLLVLLPTQAFAQSAPAKQQTPSDPNRALSDVEAGGTWLGWGNTNFSVGTDCARIVSIEQGLQREANASQRLGEGFGKFGQALTVVTAMSQAAQGKYQDATQTMGEAAFDKALCWVIPVAACAGWNAGRAIGATIKMMPWPGDDQRRTIEDVVTDKEVQWLLPYLDQPMNVKNMEAAFAAFQRKQAEIRAAQERARQFAGQCSMNHPDPAAEDVAAADGPARQSTSSDRAMSRYSDLAPAYVPPASSYDTGWGQTSAPTYSAPPPQQTQSSSNSGFNWGQAVGAALVGYAAGKTANQSSKAQQSYTPPQSSDDGCHLSQLPPGSVCTAN